LLIRAGAQALSPQEWRLVWRERASSPYRATLIGRNSTYTDSQSGNTLPTTDINVTTAFGTGFIVILSKKCALLKSRKAQFSSCSLQVLLRT
jgi:hypothetical protein